MQIHMAPMPFLQYLGQSEAESEDAEMSETEDQTMEEAKPKKPALPKLSSLGISCYIFFCLTGTTLSFPQVYRPEEILGTTIPAQLVLFEG